MDDSIEVLCSCNTKDNEQDRQGGLQVHLQPVRRARHPWCMSSSVKNWLGGAVILGGVSILVPYPQ